MSEYGFFLDDDDDELDADCVVFRKPQVRSSEEKGRQRHCAEV